MKRLPVSVDLMIFAKTNSQLGAGGRTVNQT